MCLQDKREFSQRRMTAALPREVGERERQAHGRKAVQSLTVLLFGLRYRGS